MSERKMRFRIGLFVLATLILLAGLIFMFGNFPNLFKSGEGQTYTLLFSDAPGVQSGTPVRKSGVKIGEVEEVNLDDETGEVSLKIRIRPGRTIRKSDEATLATALLTGDASIDFMPKPVPDGQVPDRNPRDPKQPIRGRPPTNVDRLLAQASQVVSPAQKALESIQKSLKELEKLTPEVRATLTQYRKLAEDARKQIPEIGNTSKEIQKLTRQVQQAVPDIQATTKEIGNLTRDVRKIVPDVQATVKDIGSVTGDIRKAMPDVQSALKEIGNLAKETRLVVPDVRAATQEATKLIKSANETMPTIKKTIGEFELTASNWSAVGERINLMLTTNQDKINAIVENTNKAIENISEIFSEGNREKISTILTNVAPATKELPSIARNAKNLLEEGRGFIRTLEKSVGNADSVINNLKSLTDPDSAVSKGLFASLNSASKKLNGILTDVQVIIQSAAKADGTIRRLLADPAIFNHIDDAILMVTKILPRVDRILKDVEVFADKVARHPEKIGVGGLVRPDSGLKDTPVRPRFFPGGN